MTIDEVASAVIEKLRGKVIIHRYDAYGTNSVYLKFDYGIANSLRISDHPGKRYLKYRYNIITTQKSKKSKRDCGYERIFYGPEMVNAVCRDILAEKEEKEKIFQKKPCTLRKNCKFAVMEQGEERKNIKYVTFGTEISLKSMARMRDRQRSCWI